MLNIEPIQEGSGDPSPDNIRPISGLTGATLYQTGRNIYDKNATDPSNGYVAGSYLAGNGTVIELSSWNISEYIEIDNTNIILSVPVGYSPSICFYDINKQFISGNSYQNRKTLQITAPANAKYTRISVPINGIDGVRLAYGTKIDVTWSDTVGTVYGATVDVVSGEMTVDRVLTTINQLGAWTGGTTGDRYYVICIKQDARDVGASPTQSEGLAILSNIKNMGVYGVSSMRDGSAAQYNKSFRIYDSTCSTLAEYMTKYGSGQICYYLAEPITYQLTAQQINALFGTNVIWSDSINSIDMKYTGYIDD